MNGDEPEDDPPYVLNLLADDKYAIAEGPAKGMRGFFTRDDSGAVDGINLGARLATRVRAQDGAAVGAH